MNKTKVPTEIWALITGGFCIALGIGIVGPIIPQLAESFGVSITAAAATVSAFALMRIIAAPFASWFVRRTNERKSYMLGLFLVAATTFACGFATNYQLLLTFRTLSGIGSVLFTVAASTLIIRLAPAQMRGRIHSYNAAGFLLGALIGPVIGALVAGISMQTPFFVYTVLLIFAGVFVAVALRKSTLRAAGKSVDAPPTEVLHLGEALHSGVFKAALYSAFTTGWAVYGVRVTIVPLFIASIVENNLAAPGWALTAYAAGNAVLVIPSGYWNDKIGRKPLVLLGFTISALAYAALPFMQELAGALIIMAIAGIGSALLNPAQNAAISDVVGRRNGATAVSTYSMMLDFGSVIGPLLIGFVVDHSGYQLGFWITAALLATTLVAWAFAPESSTSARLRASKAPNTDRAETKLTPKFLDVGPETGALPTIRVVSERDEKPENENGK